MFYTTLEELKEVFFEKVAVLYDDQAGDMLDAVVTSTWDSAESEVHLYIGQQYTIPVTSVTAVPLLRQISFVIFQIHSHLRRPDSDVPDDLMALYEMYIKQLRDIANGKIKLPLGDEEIPVDIAISVDIDSDESIFSFRKTMRDSL